MIEVDYNEYKETIAENMKLIVENNKLQQRIDKAIKHIEYDLEITEHLYDSGSYDTNYIREELLEILKGSEK